MSAEILDRLLAAALVVATRDGIAGLTLRAVAVESGLPLSTATVYFGSKEQLVAELFCRTLAAQPRPADGYRHAVELRNLIDDEVRRRVRAALGSSEETSAADVLEVLYAGSILNAALAAGEHGTHPVDDFARRILSR